MFHSHMCRPVRRSNGAARSKRRRALKTALCIQTVQRARNSAARSKRRGALKMALRVQTVLRAQNGAARSNGVVRSNEGRQGVGKGSAD
jgi:hypothetical protein